MTKELRDSKRKTEPQENGAVYSVKGEANGTIDEPKSESLSSGFSSYSSPPITAPVSCLYAP